MRLPHVTGPSERQQHGSDYCLQDTGHCTKRAAYRNTLATFLWCQCRQYSEGTKTQYQVQFGAWMTATDKCEGLLNGFQQTGHSHNAVDQRCSAAHTIPRSVPTLEDPQDFTQYFETHLTLVRGCVLHLEVLDTVMDFRAWLAPLGTKLKCLSATHNNFDTHHSWVFITHKLLGSVAGYDGQVVEHLRPAWQELRKSDDDVSPLLTESLGSSRLSQKPMLILLASIANTIDVAHLKLAQRSCLPENVVQEYRNIA